MGQRLVINIFNSIDDDEAPMANAYYHWSAFSSSAISIVMSAIDAYESYYGNLPNECDNRKLAVMMLENTNAGINPGEKEEIENSGILKCYKIKDAIDRNEGLLSITDKGINESIRWSEGTVDIFICEREVKFGIYDIVSKSEYISQNSEDEYNNLGVLNNFIFHDTFTAPVSLLFKFEDIFKMVEEINSSDYIKTQGGDVVQWVR